METPKRENIVLTVSKTSKKEILINYFLFLRPFAFNVLSNYCSCTDRDDNIMLNKALT